MEMQTEDRAVAPRPDENGIAVQSASESAETERQADEVYDEINSPEHGAQDAPVSTGTASGESNASSATNQPNSDGVANHTLPVSELQSQTSSANPERLSKLLWALSASERSNDEMKTTVAENCRLIADLRATCALLEKKNAEFEHAIMKLRSTDDKMAADVNRLSTEIAGLATANACASKHDDGKSANDGTEKQAPNALPQPTVEQRVADLELRTADSSNRITELSTSVNNIERDLQRFIRRHSLVIEHLCPKEDRSAQDAFLVFVKSVLGVTADESDIDGLHLIDKPETDADTAANASASGSPAKSSGAFPRPVLVTFTCYRTRMKVYKAWLSYRVGASGDSKAAVGALSGERGQGVCIREYLTAAQEMVYRAANDIRHRRPDMITDCWTFRGRTFIRTAQGDVREFSEVDQMMTKDDSRHRACRVM